MLIAKGFFTTPESLWGTFFIPLSDSLPDSRRHLSRRKKSAKRKYLVRAFVYGKRFWCLKVCILGVQFISSIHFALSSSLGGWNIFTFLSIPICLFIIYHDETFFHVLFLVKRSSHYFHRDETFHVPSFEIKAYIYSKKIKKYINECLNLPFSLSTCSQFEQPDISLLY